MKLCYGVPDNDSQVRLPWLQHQDQGTNSVDLPETDSRPGGYTTLTDRLEPQRQVNIDQESNDTVQDNEGTNNTVQDNEGTNNTVQDNEGTNDIVQDNEGIDTGDNGREVMSRPRRTRRPPDKGPFVSY